VIDGIFGTWTELRRSASYMYEMEISTNMMSEITGNIIFQLTILRFQS